MAEQSKTNLTNLDTWIRLLYMLLFCVVLFVTRIVVWIIATLQFLLVLIMGSDNRNLRNFGQGLGKWVYQILLFLTFNTEHKPYPFDEWPDIEEMPGVILREDAEVEDATDVTTATSTPPSQSAEGGDDVPAFTDVSSSTEEGTESSTDKE